VSLPKRYGDFEVREVLLRVSDLSIERDQRPILSRVSLQLHRGDWLALSGEVGSGKSTLLQTFAGLNRSFSGDVFVNGESIKALQRSKRLSDLRNIAYAAERPFVFSGSIKHNLCLNQSFTDQELWSVLSLVGLADELTSSCRDLESLVGEGGVSLSGGQRQRLALARLILRPSLLVLLDDPLSAVDTDTEAKVMKNLRRIWTDCAVICASNKPSTLSYCDKIGVVAHNRVEIDGASMSHVFHDHPKEISNFMEQPSHG
jgi:ATP-binding cassette subfamily B protein